MQWRVTLPPCSPSPEVGDCCAARRCRRDRCLRRRPRRPRKRGKPGRPAKPQPAPGRGQTPAPPPATLGLDHGTLDFDTPDFRLKLVKDSQTIAALEPKGAKGIDANTPFDFTPADQLTARQGDRFNHLGDITLRREAGRLAGRRVGRSRVERRAQAGDAAFSGSKTTPAGSKLLAGARSCTPTMGAGRRAGRDRARRGCSTRPAVSSCTSTSGTRARRPSRSAASDFPVVFNNMIQNFVTNRARTLPQAHEICSFFDPYVGRDAGYLQVTRLSGAGPGAGRRAGDRHADAVRGVSSAERRVAPRSDVRGRVRMDRRTARRTRRTSGRAPTRGTRRRR